MDGFWKRQRWLYDQPEHDERVPLTAYLNNPERYPNVATTPGLPPSPRAAVRSPGALSSIIAPEQQPALSAPMSAPNSEITAPGMAFRALTAAPTGMTGGPAMDRSARRGLEPPSAPAAMLPQYGQRSDDSRAWDASLIRAQRQIEAERQLARERSVMLAESARQEHERRFGALARYMPTGEEVRDRAQGAWRNFQRYVNENTLPGYARRQGQAVR